MATDEQSPMHTDPGASAPLAQIPTLTSVIDGYTEAGFAGSFSVLADAELECHACNERFLAGAAAMSSLRRLEGQSDPDDMMAVAAISCPNCGMRGTVILGYGPMASAEDGDVLQALRDDRGDAHLPGNSAPGEAVGDGSDGAAHVGTESARR